MLRLFEVSGRGQPRRFSVGSLTVIGRRSARNLRRRALLFSDSFGPTLQINFIRPLSTFREPWGTWTVTEASHGDLESAASLGKVEQDIDRALVDFRPNVIVASRYAGPLTNCIIAAAANYRIPLIAHLDDNLFDIPETAGDEFAKRHASPQRKQHLASLLAQADLDLISTPALHHILHKLCVLGPRSRVAEIAGAATVFRRPRQLTGDKIVFGYMGTRSHAADLAMVTPQIIQVLERHPAARFELFGSIETPLELSRFAVKHHKKIRDYGQFLRKLGSLRWTFGLAPLELTPFNLAKTNIKWVEYTSAGIPVVASDHPVYRECCSGGAGMLAGPDAWYGAMSELLASAELRQSLFKAAAAKLVHEYSPVKLYDQLMDAFAAAGVTC
jgi:hypothetical protein